jgi:hypothetical protein
MAINETALHPAAPHHLPAFITAPGETDVLMVVTGTVLLLGILLFGSVFFRVHTLPERMAHKGQKLQFEIVAVLGLLALFTHIHLFWVAGLLLALIDIPDFGGSLSRIAGSTEKLAGLAPGKGAVDLPEPATHAPAHAHAHAPAHARAHAHAQGDSAAAVAASPELAPDGARR